MKRRFYILFGSLFIQLGLAQEPDLQTDYKYREDQFYVGISYCLLYDTPSKISQEGFSTSFYLGFIRDMPINEKRTLALGLGLGYGYSSLNQNLIITKANESYTYKTLSSDEYTKNRLYVHHLELPFELRFRNSSSENRRFFRVHTGVKISYVFTNRYKFFNAEHTTRLDDLDDIRKFNTSLTFSIGHGTWNFFFQYGLNTVFDKGAKIDKSYIELKPMNIGLIYYIL